MKSFYVINWDINTKNIYKKDIIPYLVDKYKECKGKNIPKTFEEFKEFVKNKSAHQWWSRCEYEVLISNWPYGSFKFKNNINNFLENKFNEISKNVSNNILSKSEILLYIKNNLNVNEFDDLLKLENIVTSEMYKIDVHEQIMMNLEVITSIVKEECDEIRKSKRRKKRTTTLD